MYILVVDDHPIVRLGIVKLIERTWPSATVGESGSLASARGQIAAVRPDVITLDLNLPDAQGTEALTDLLRYAKGVPILVLSQGSEEMHAQRAMQIGAAGYLAKDRAADELAQALLRVLQGGRYVSPALAARLLAMLEGGNTHTLPHEMLTPQEHRVMQLIASGMRASQIATTMKLSVKTVANYRARIFDKTGWRNNIELTKYCVQHGLTSAD